MAISTVSASTAAIAPAAQPRPQPQTSEVQRAPEQQSINKGPVGNITPPPPPPKPTVNANGETIGTLVNVTA